MEEKYSSNKFHMDKKVLKKCDQYNNNKNS